jgi:predicted nucleotidyltransferase component of viral defense system
MLQYSTVEPRTLDILRQLIQIPELKNFYLVGGTALALYYGHRKSIDLDLFSAVDFQNDEILPALEKIPGFAYSNIHNPVGIRIFNVRDIIAMKISAVLKRAVKKDFWDISELLYHFTIEDFINFYNSKYPNQQLLISIPQALTYFADAEESEEPSSLKGQTWKGVKKHIQQKVNDYLR